MILLTVVVGKDPEIGNWLVLWGTAHILSSLNFSFGASMAMRIILPQIGLKQSYNNYVWQTGETVIRGRMSQGGEKPLQGIWEEFDSLRLHYFSGL